MTAVLLVLGPLAMIGFAAVLTVEGARRPGYDPRYHTGSELELGRRGWVQQVNFAAAGAGLVLFALGVRQELQSLGGATLLAIAGLGLVGAGIFPPDPVRGYPPGASATSGRPTTFGARVHDALGPLTFVALLAAAVVLMGRLEGVWRSYTLVTAALGSGLLVATVAAYRRDSRRTGLVQRLLVFSCFLWVAVLGAVLTLDGV